MTRALNFRGQWLEPRPKEESPTPRDPRCGIIAYYPNMLARADSESSGQTAGHVPLAFAPWCEGLKTKQAAWPGRKHKGDGGSRSVVWHNWNAANRTSDCYLVLSLVSSPLASFTLPGRVDGVRSRDLKADMLSSDDTKFEDFGSVKAHWAVSCCAWYDSSLDLTDLTQSR